MEHTDTALFWHRRDLRIHDNAGIHAALTSGRHIQPVFVFDAVILRDLPGNDQRVLFIYRQIERLKNAYLELGSDLVVVYGDPLDCIPDLANRFRASQVFTNRDYEPYALERDRQLFTLLREKGIRLTGAKDQVIFEKNDVLKPDGKPYVIFTPYMRRWKETLNSIHLSSYPNEQFFGQLNPTSEPTPLAELSSMGFSDRQLVEFPPVVPETSVLETYDKTRDFPAMNGTSRLSIHLRFGTISIRELVQTAIATNETFLNELIWRDFYQMILYHFPHSVHRSFKPEYDRIRWDNNETHFQLWCTGKTGYPLVDAGMRELNATGHLHNRVRMVVASFLTKHLLIDWRLGERYFAEKLLDFELASNVGGWQWASGSGCDAAPYFRVFNPTSQQEKFDPQLEYVRRWVPEFGTADYPEPIVDHAFARERVLARYKEGLSG